MDREGPRGCVAVVTEWDQVPVSARGVVLRLCFEVPRARCDQRHRGPTMLCDHCGDCYELLTDVRVLNQFLKGFDGGRTRCEY